MVGYGAKFSRKMEQAVAAMLSCRTVEEAARMAGIGTNTLRRWIRRPEFEAAYREARATLLSQAVARLQGASGAAATTVLKIMLSPDAPAGARLRAAEIVLEQATKASSMEDLEVRLANLERKVGLKKISRRCPAGITLLRATPLLAPSPRQAQAAARLDGTVSDEGGEE
jgi:hypothetical protein